MCLEDLAISRRAYVRTTTDAGASPKSFPANQYRIGIIAQARVAVGYTIVIAKSMSDAQGMFAIVGGAYKEAAPINLFGTVDVRMTYRSHPGMIQEELWVYASGVAITVHELLVPPTVDAAVQAFMQERGW